MVAALQRKVRNFLPEAEHIIETLERAIHSIRLANKLERPMLNVGNFAEYR